MTEAPTTCGLDDSLNRAAQIMWELDCGCVPVVDASGKTAGVVTDRDICIAAYTQGRGLNDISVASVTANRPTISCSPQDEIEDAEALMKEHQIRRLPVTDPAGKLVGILSFSDLALQSISKGKKKGITPARLGALAAAVSKNARAAA